jgi:hypothetical protein
LPCEANHYCMYLFSTLHRVSFALFVFSPHQLNMKKKKR